jgi:hypothetical protein
MTIAPTDNDVRLAVYRHFVAEGSAPSSAEIAETLGTGVALIRRSFEYLAQGRILVLEQDSREIRMAMPFSAVRTAYRVTHGERSWWAN